MRTSFTNYARQAAVANVHSVVYGQGCRIDWSKIGDAYLPGVETIKLNGAAAIAATSLTVDALPVDLPLGTILNFGTLAPVTVTLADASVSAGDTSITVAALSGPIPAGTRLNFTGGTNAQLAELSAAAITGATTLTVLPLDGTIANTQTATYNGGTQQARVTAEALAGATTVTVDELQFLIADDSTAYFAPRGLNNKKQIPALTAMVYQADGSAVPRSERTASETVAFLLASEAVQDSGSVGYTGYGSIVAGEFYENLLPDFSTTYPSAYKTELAANGCYFRFVTYYDNGEV